MRLTDEQLAVLDITDSIGHLIGDTEHGIIELPISVLKQWKNKSALMMDVILELDIRQNVMLNSIKHVADLNEKINNHENIFKKLLDIEE